MLIKNKKGLVFVSIAMSLLLIVSVIGIFMPSKSFADVPDFPIDPNPKVPGTHFREYSHDLADFEERAEKDRLNNYNLKEDFWEKPSYHKNWADCFGQAHWATGPIFHFNQIHTYIDGEDYPFDYSVTGFFGDWDGEWKRRANVQFFYNPVTKVLRILCFGDGVKGFNTYNYHSGSSILEDEPEIAYCPGEWPWHFQKFYISQEVETIELDPKLQKIMRRGFQNMPHLKTVDIIGQKYDQSQLNEVKDYAFRKCGKENSNHGYVKMNILECKNLKTFESDWADDTNVES